MKTVANKQKICDVLMEAAKTDKDIVALCSDSRGSGSFTPFADSISRAVCRNRYCRTGSCKYCSRTCEDVVKRAYAVSPASFLSTRSYEQCKVDVAYSNTNVKLIGISGGISYGALGMSHHSAQDIAAMSQQSLTCEFIFQVMHCTDGEINRRIIKRRKTSIYSCWKKCGGRCL